nr:retrovirus-related Pol polyprotein from transposon TNT 1-94 [Tanacetum cinerariifolium]
MGYYFYYPPKNKIVVERYADFLEKDFILQKESGRIVELEDEDILPSKNTSEHPIEEESHAPIVSQEEDVIPVHIYRARLVAKGCTQTYGVDYEEKFSPVADIRAIRFLIVIASYYDYEIWQMDVKTMFLNGFLEEEIYMEQPEGFIDPIYLRKVCAVVWKSSKESTTAQHATEVEYIAAFEAAKEAIWIRKFIDELCVIPLNDYLIKINCDNSATIIMAKESGIQKGARHFQRKYHYVHECIETGEIDIVKVHTDDNLADLFTKALAGPKLTRHVRSMGLRPASSFM